MDLRLVIIGLFLLIVVIGVFLSQRPKTRNIESKGPKSKQKELLGSDEKYRLLFECAFDVIFSFDRSFRVTSVSPSVERVLGYKPVEIIGRFFPQMGILAPEYHRTAFSQIARLFAGDTLEPTVYEFIAKDGTRRIAELSGAPLIQDNEIVGVISVARDITEKNKLEKKLVTEREQLFTIFNTFIQPISIIDLNTYEILFCNDTLMRLYGKNPIGGLCYKQLHGLDAPCSWCRISKLKEQNYSPIKTEFHNPTLNRDYISISLVMKWEDGRDAKFEIAIDITDKRRYEKELEQANKELEIGVKERSILQNQIIRSERTVTAGLLAASIAHDIKSPLTAVLAYICIIKEKLKDNKSVSEQIALIEKGFCDIEHIARRLSNFSCTTMEKHQLVNINSIIEDIVALMQAYIMQKGISIRLNLSSDVPDINASVQHLRHAVMNLINNAVEAIVEEYPHAFGATPNGEISISTFFRSGKIVVEFSDTGPGIPEDDLAHIFDPFHTTKKQTGTGLGLYICQNILKEYNGTISAKNLPGKGANFTLELPAN